MNEAPTCPVCGDEMRAVQAVNLDDDPTTIEYTIYRCDACGHIVHDISG